MDGHTEFLLRYCPKLLRQIEKIKVAHPDGIAECGICRIPILVPAGAVQWTCPACDAALLRVLGDARAIQQRRANEI